MDKSQLLELESELRRRESELKRLILDLEADLREGIKDNEAGEPKVDYNHPADMLDTSEFDYEKNLELIARERRELLLVTHALAKFARGEYGLCESCGIEIPYPRLSAVPFARYCIDCQEEAEAGEAGALAPPESARADEGKKVI